MPKNPRAKVEPERREYETLQAAADRLKCTPHHLRKLIADGELTGYRLGSRAIRVDAAELDALLQPIPTAVGGAL